MRARNQANRNENERGAATVTALFAVVMLLALSGAILFVTMGTNRERGSIVHSRKALFAAESGVSHFVAELLAGNDGPIASDAAPQDFAEGAYWVAVEETEEGDYVVTSTGVQRGARRSVEAVVSPLMGGVFSNAVFAGNTGGDPLYVLEFGGMGDQGDYVEGDVYSGGDFNVWGDATITGDVDAAGTITGTTGTMGAKQPVPDLAAMDYANTAEIDVAAEFATAAAYLDSIDQGGEAYQLPEDNPAHIFRLNPDDRTDVTDATPKDDYFLEDPYEPFSADPDSDGSSPWGFTLSGVSGEPGPSGNGKVYYIDGNLWLHNLRSYSFTFDHSEPDGVQVTFVVKGNVYFSDNLFYDNQAKDGVAFIAMEDPDVEDSGNIYFGDPQFGTLEHMDAYMYAENNFHDTNLSATGSAIVELFGIMSAGNQVDIERDYGDEHSKLGVKFDERVETGELVMPGLPGKGGGGLEGYEIVSWREVGIP